MFPDPKGRAAVPVVVHMKTANLRFTVDEDKGTYTGEAVIVARIRNAAGQTVHTLSQQYLLTGASKDVGTARETARSSSIGSPISRRACTPSRRSSRTSSRNVRAPGCPR